MAAHVIHPKLDSTVERAELPGGALLLRHPGHGTQLAIPARDLPVLRAMDGTRSLEALEEVAMQALGGEEGAGALGYQALVMILFQLWDRGMLADEQEVREALFPHHKTRTLDRAKAKRWLSMVADVHLYSAAGADVLRWSGFAGRLNVSTPVLMLRYLVGAAGLALLLTGAVAWPGHLLRLDGSFEEGLPLFYVTAALALSLRGWVRASILAAPGIGPGLRSAGVRIAGGIVHVDVEDSAIYHCDLSVQRRFALSGLGVPFELGGICALLALAGVGGGAAVLASATCYLVFFLDLSPFMRTDGARLVELLSSVSKQRFRVKTYMQRRMVRGVFGGRSKEAGAMAVVALVWVAWFFAAFRILADVLLEDMVQLVAAMLTTGSGMLVLLGMPFVIALIVLSFVMLGVLAWVLVQAVLQVVTSESGGTAPAEEKADPEELVQLLAELPVASAMPEAARRILAERASVATYRGGEWIHRAQDGAEQIAWVLSGRVELLRDLPEGGHQLVAVLSAGGQFGAEAVAGGRQDLDVRAECDVRLAVIDADTLRHALSESEGELQRALELAQFLDGVPELTGLGPSARLDVAMQASLRQAAPNDVIIRQGDAPTALFLVRSGGCVASRVEEGANEEIELGRIAPGQTFGEIGLLLRRPRTASVKCTEETSLVVLPADVLDAALRRSFHVGLALEKLASARLAEAETRTKTDLSLVDRASGGGAGGAGGGEASPGAPA